MEAAVLEVLLFVVQIAIEVLGQALLEVVAEVGFSSLKAALDRPSRNPLLAALGYLILGALVGGATLALWPARLVPPGPVPGLSLVLGPLAVGGLMQSWGRYRLSRGHVTTNLATFLGGAAFAFGTALVRFLWAS